MTATSDERREEVTAELSRKVAAKLRREFAIFTTQAISTLRFVLCAGESWCAMSRHLSEFAYIACLLSSLAGLMLGKMDHAILLAVLAVSFKLDLMLEDR